MKNTKQVKMKEVRFNKKDSAGDTWCPKYESYVNKNTSFVFGHAKQLEENYESAFGHIPTADEMEQAVNFVSLFLAEVAETTANSHYNVMTTNRLSSMACQVASLIEEDDLIRTCENIAEYSSIESEEAIARRIKMKIAELG